MEANGPVLRYGLQILIVGIVAAELGESEVATWVSWVLFVVGILLLLFTCGRTDSVRNLSKSRSELIHAPICI